MDSTSLNNFTYFGTDEHDQKVIPDVVSPETYFQIVRCIVGIRILVCLVGLWTNVLNIRTFLRIGLNDSVTICFFALAISDIGILTAGLGFNLCRVLEILQKDFNVHDIPIRPDFIAVYFILSGGTFSTTTVMMTALLALQRSLCVARPFQFKAMFTRRSTSIVIVIMALFSSVYMILFMSKHSLKKVFNPSTNESTYVLLYLPGRYEMRMFMYLGLGIVLNSICQVVTGGSVIVMNYYLQKSVRFRQTLTVQTGAHDKTNCDDTKTTDSEKLAPSNTKEKQAIVQVLLLSIVFLTTTAPFLIISFVRLFIPTFSSSGMLFTSLTCYEFKYLFDYINSAVNFCIYYKYNTKFRQLCFRKKK